MKIYGLTDKGIVRENNQDFFAAEKLSENVAFAVVCDGMGGANAGNIASKIAAETITAYIKKSYRQSLSSIALENILRGALVSANAEVYEASKKNKEQAGMGTTAVLAFIDNQMGYVLHVGDSRAYLMEDDKLIQLTVDHSMVQTLVDSGEITADQAKVHPKKNIITRALGINKEVVVDLDVFDLNPNTALLLCTDGLTNFVGEDVIKTELTNINDTIVQRLIQRANDNGGADNITAVVVTQ